LSSALAAAQAVLEDPIKNSLNPHFKSEYVDLGTLMATVRPAMAAQGLAINTVIDFLTRDVKTVTRVTSKDGCLTETTVTTEEQYGHQIRAVIEGYGESRRSTIFCPPQSNVQQFASFHTYARRWLIGGLCGVAEAKDDDGNGAVPQQAAREQIMNHGRR